MKLIVCKTRCDGGAKSSECAIGMRSYGMITDYFCYHTHTHTHRHTHIHIHEHIVVIILL